MRKISSKLACLIAAVVLCLVALGAVIIGIQQRKYTSLANFQKTTEVAVQIYNLSAAITSERPESWYAATLPGPLTPKEQLDRFRQFADKTIAAKKELTTNVKGNRDRFSSRFATAVLKAADLDNAVQQQRDRFLAPDRVLVRDTSTAAGNSAYPAYDAEKTALDDTLPMVAFETEDGELVRKIQLQDLVSRSKADVFRIRGLVSSMLRRNTISQGSLTEFSVRRQTLEDALHRLDLMGDAKLHAWLDRLQKLDAYVTILDLESKLVKLKAGDQDLKAVYDFDTYQNGAYAKIEEFYDQFSRAVAQDIADYTAARLAEAKRALWFAYLSVGAMVIGVSVLIIWISRSIARPLRVACDTLNDASQTAMQSARALGESSSKLSHDASDSAATLEEVGASVEEMSSMTQSNLANVREVAALASKARTTADDGAKIVASLHEAMTNMEANNKDVAKVLKTIEEIAFQTNILALNAAVEAARAGEAGAGFAVVADEVRNLARRCTEAANQTATKVSTVLTAYADTSHLGEKVQASFQEIAGITHSYHAKVQEIEQASEQSATGVRQIAEAVTHLQTITQNTAAAAEENAACSQEIVRQSDELLQQIGALEVMAGTRDVAGDSDPAGPENGAGDGGGAAGGAGGRMAPADHFADAEKPAKESVPA